MILSILYIKKKNTLYNLKNKQFQEKEKKGKEWKLESNFFRRYTIREITKKEKNQICTQRLRSYPYWSHLDIMQYNE